MIKKSDARNLMSDKRSKLDEFFMKSASLKISEIAYGFINSNSFKEIAIYMSIKNEVRIQYIIDIDKGKGKNFNLFLPVCKKEDYIIFNKLEDINLITEKDYFGISCPKNENYINESKIEVFFIPGLAFDIFGNRVGYGKGCFDKALKNISKSYFVGVCYDFQLISNDILEFDENDVKMDFLLTEKGMRQAIKLQ